MYKPVRNQLRVVLSGAIMRSAGPCILLSDSHLTLEHCPGVLETGRPQDRTVLPGESQTHARYLCRCSVVCKGLCKDYITKGNIGFALLILLYETSDT
jgi:hypothetical protein